MDFPPCQMVLHHRRVWLINLHWCRACAGGLYNTVPVTSSCFEVAPKVAEPPRECSSKVRAGLEFFPYCGFHFNNTIKDDTESWSSPGHSHWLYLHTLRKSHCPTSLKQISEEKEVQPQQFYSIITHGVSLLLFRKSKKSLHVSWLCCVAGRK